MKKRDNVTHFTMKIISMHLHST